jgi:NitT/TauT family transport system substrate-binding protein
LHIGVIKALGTVAPYIAQEKKYYEDEGLNVEISEFSDGSAMMEAFAGGELDVTVGGVAPVANWYSKGVDIKVVASCNGGGHVILTREDTGIKSVADLKGHVLAEPNLGTVTDTLLRDYILKGAGLNPDTDVQIESGLKPADMATALFDTREVDAIITWEPYVAQAEQKYDDLVVLYDSPVEIKQATSSESFYPVNVVAASGDLINDRPDTLNKFLNAYKRAVDYINSDEDANEDIATILEMDKSIVESARQRIDFTYDIDKDGLERTLSWTKNLGYIDEIPSKDEFYYEGNQ